MYQNDHWNISDELGISQASDGVAKMSLSVTAPFTIAVTGKWGSGKTSLLRHAFATLGGAPISQAVPLGDNNAPKDDKPQGWSELCAYTYEEENGAAEKRRQQLNWSEDEYRLAERSLCVWYSPWQHQNAGNPLIPLLLEIQQQLTLLHKIKHKGNASWRGSALAAFTLFERLIDSVPSLFGEKTKLTGTTDAVRKVWKETVSDLTKLSDGQRFHLLFEDAVEMALTSVNQNEESELSTKDARLIIFIDDLDRCEEGVVIELLEAIKLYLGTQQCVFILGLDDTAVLTALQNHWPNRSLDHNREYLEKLFQAVVNVPIPQDHKSQTLISQQLKAHDVPEPDRWAKTIVQLLEPNPRKLKNFTNSLCAVWNLHHPPQDDLTILRLVLFQYLRLYHPPVWRILERQPWSLRILRQVLLNSNEAVELTDGYNQADQRMMQKFFSRAFSHVLQHDSSEKSDDNKHRGLELEKAVHLFLERIDRKRSDEEFVRLAEKAFDEDTIVEAHFLCIAHNNADCSLP